MSSADNGRKRTRVASTASCATSPRRTLTAVRNTNARAEIEAVAGDDDNPLQVALREMLRQRLWLQQNGQTATLRELDTVRVSIDQARGRIEAQLERIERARAPLT